MLLSDRVVVDLDILQGKPTIRGTRLGVEFLLGLLAAGQLEPDILASYPGLTTADLLACCSYQSASDEAAGG
jgi:uncharacterized protein (DUF433 family)